MKRNFLKLVAIGWRFGGWKLVCLCRGTPVRERSFLICFGRSSSFNRVITPFDESPNSGVLTVSGEGRGAVVVTIPTELSKSNAVSSVRFVTDGHEYHLVAVQMDSENSRAVDSQVYREHKLLSALAS